MGKRWAIASDPALLARIAQQEASRGVRGAGKVMAANVEAPAAVQDAPAKRPSAATARAKKVAEANQDSRKDSVTYDESTNTLTITLAGAQLLSHNVTIRMHDAKLTKLKATWQKRMEALMLTNIATYDLWKKNQARAFPLIIEEVYATCEGNMLDVESVVTACKPIIDAMVRTRFIPDDRREFVAQPIGYTFKQPNPGLVLVLRPAPKPWGEISDTTMQHARLMPSLVD